MNHINSNFCYFFSKLSLTFFSPTEGGEIRVYGLTKTEWQISSVELHVEKKNRHGYQLQHLLGRQDHKQHDGRHRDYKSKGLPCYLGSREKKDEKMVEKQEDTADRQSCKKTID